jgi:hypothetical protein
MIAIVRRLLPLLLLVAWLGPALACDGTPPKLINKDSKAHDYELLCAGKTEKRSIPAGATQELRGKSGCKLKLGDNQPTKLFTEMVCTIQSDKLSCDLL